MTTRSIFAASPPPGTYAQHTDGAPSIVLGTCFYATQALVGAKIIGGRLWVPAGVGGGTATCTLRLAVKSAANNLDTAAVQTKVVTWAGDTKWVDALFDVPQDVPAAGVRWMIAWQQADPIRYNSSLDFRATGAAVAASDGSPIVLAEFDQPAGPLGPVRDRYFRFGTDAPGVSPAVEGGYATDTLVDIPDTDPNTPPTANAGPNQVVAAGSLVTLTGAASTDPDGTVATYAWSQTGGTAVTLSGAGAVRTFTAPNAAGALTFSLAVVDNDGAPSGVSDAVVVTVLPPVAPPTTTPSQGLSADDLAYMRETQAEHRPTQANLFARTEPMSDGMGGTLPGATGGYTPDGVPVQVRIDYSPGDKNTPGGSIPTNLADRYGSSNLARITMDLVPVKALDRLTEQDTGQVWTIVSDGAIGTWTTALQVWAVKGAAT